VTTNKLSDSRNDVTNKWVVALTGASGTLYGRRLLEVLLHSDYQLELDVILSEAACRVLHEEEGLNVSANNPQLEALVGFPDARVQMHSVRDIGAQVASGSSATAGMVIVPCSMSTLGAIANGCGYNLIHRAADVTLKEGRKLILVPRETPLSVLHLEHLLKVARAGATVIPAMPGFYHRPQQIEDLVDMLVMRVADQMGLPAEICPRWKIEKGS